jgi:mono/diheme cytochrome c family protein
MKSIKRVKIMVLVLCAIFAFAITRATLAAVDPAAEAQSLFNSKCAICHGADGSGNTANGKKLNVRDLRCPEVQKLSDSQLYDVIGHGKNKMPGYETSLGKDSVIKLVNFTRELSKKH